MFSSLSLHSSIGQSIDLIHQTDVTSCDVDACVGSSSGTAAVYRVGLKETGNSHRSLKTANERKMVRRRLAFPVDNSNRSSSWTMSEDAATH